MILDTERTEADTDWLRANRLKKEGTKKSKKKLKRMEKTFLIREAADTITKRLNAEQESE